MCFSALLPQGCKSFPTQALDFTCLSYKSCENVVGKGEIARISPFPTVFSTHLENFSTFSSHLKNLQSTNSFG